jgi:hypothetical protein
LQCQDEELAHMLHTWCGKFQSAEEPDFWLEIELEQGCTVAEIQRIMPQLRLSARDGHFRSHPSLLEGEVSWTERRLRFRTARALFHPGIQPRFLNVLFSSIYNTICESRNGDGREAFLFHGCGVIVKGKGYLFTGPSGAGKTTVARLAAERAVLNDEAVLLKMQDGEVWMGGTPLLGGVNQRMATWVPLQAILVLQHGEDVELRPLGKGEAYPRFLSQLFAPTPMIGVRPPLNPPREQGGGAPALPAIGTRKRFLEQQAGFSAAVLNRVQVYELYFRPDGSFWPHVEALSCYSPPVGEG